MNEPTLQVIESELATALIDRRFSRIFSLSKLVIVIDLGLSGGRYLLIGVEPQSPRIYLIKRRIRDLEQSSVRDRAFASLLRKRLANARLTEIEKINDERVLLFRFEPFTTSGDENRTTLAVQLTGRSSNLFLIGSDNKIIDSIRRTRGEGQERGTVYAPPARSSRQVRVEEPFDPGAFKSMSEALDVHFSKLKDRRQREELEKSSLNEIQKEIRKRKRLVRALRKDLDNHGNPELWKRLGDILLANVSGARSTDLGFIVKDYFDESTPEIEVEAKTGRTVTEAAEEYFRKFSKSKKAAVEIEKRLRQVDIEIKELEKTLVRLNDAIAAGDMDRISAISGVPANTAGEATRRKKSASISYARTFISADGFEILVGKKSKDNDYLTFRIARSLDTWMHAADYPGSHVVIRNPSRRDIPPGTLLEAARLAAFYSKAKGESKAAVHYTLRKFVHKPKGARPGLVSLASFKTLLVEPGLPETEKGA